MKKVSVSSRSVYSLVSEKCSCGERMVVSVSSRSVYSLMPSRARFEKNIMFPSPLGVFIL